MTHLSMGMSLEGSMDGLREDVPDWRREMEVGESRADMRRTAPAGLASSEGRRDMVVESGDAWARAGQCGGGEREEGERRG